MKTDKTILVVGNYDLIRKLLARTASEAGFSAVEIAETYEDALVKYQAIQTKAERVTIISDMTLGGYQDGGFRLAQEVNLLAHDLQVTHPLVFLVTGCYGYHKPRIDRLVADGIVSAVFAKPHLIGLDKSLRQAVHA